MTPSPGPALQAVDQINSSQWWTIAGLVIAIIAIAAAVWAARQWGTRRTLLQVDYRLRPLYPIHLKTDRGVEVIKPNPPIQFDIELRLTNRGPQDILPEHFSGHELQFGVAPAKILSDRVTSNLDSDLLVLDSNYARLYPRRIAVGRSLYFIMRTFDARPVLWVNTPLANVKVRRRRYRDQNADPMGTFTLPGANRWLRSRISEF